MARGGGERVGEHRCRSRKVAAGVVGHEEGRRRGLRGGLGGGGANGGRRRLWTSREARPGARIREERRVRTLWRSREGSRRFKGDPGRGRGRGAVGRRCTTSSWRLGDHPRRASSGFATRGEVEMLQEGTRSAEKAGARRGRGPWPAASASSADRGRRERKRESRERERLN